MTVADTLEVRRWLLGFGAEVEVMAPPALREAIRREVERRVATLAPARKPTARVDGSPASALRHARAGPMPGRRR
jgi:hypothetical protein